MARFSFGLLVVCGLSLCVPNGQPEPKVEPAAAKSLPMAHGVKTTAKSQNVQTLVFVTARVVEGKGAARRRSPTGIRTATGEGSVAFTIEFSVRARDHLKRFTKQQQPTIIDGITVQLTHQPNRVTRNRRPLQENPLAPW